MSTSVFCTASTRPVADGIVSSLKSAGFAVGDITVHASSTPTTRETCTDKLTGMGIPEAEAKRYQSKMNEGHTLISVHTKDAEGVSRARRIFQDGHAQDISNSAEHSGQQPQAAPAKTAEHAPKVSTAAVGAPSAGHRNPS